jgi:hypothetical protein
MNRSRVRWPRRAAGGSRFAVAILFLFALGADRILASDVAGPWNVLDQEQTLRGRLSASESMKRTRSFVEKLDGDVSLTYPPSRLKKRIQAGESINVNAEYRTEFNSWMDLVLDDGSRLAVSANSVFSRREDGSVELKRGAFRSTKNLRAAIFPWGAVTVTAGDCIIEAAPRLGLRVTLVSGAVTVSAEDRTLNLELAELQQITLRPDLSLLGPRAVEAGEIRDFWQSRSIKGFEQRTVPFTAATGVIGAGAAVYFIWRLTNRRWHWRWKRGVRRGLLWTMRIVIYGSGIYLSNVGAGMSARYIKVLGMKYWGLSAPVLARVIATERWIAAAPVLIWLFVWGVGYFVETRK